MERKSVDGLNGWRPDRQPLLPSLMSKWPVLSLPRDSALWGQPEMTVLFKVSFHIGWTLESRAS